MDTIREGECAKIQCQNMWRRNKNGIPDVSLQCSIAPCARKTIAKTEKVCVWAKPLRITIWCDDDAFIWFWQNTKHDDIANSQAKL